MLLPFVSSQLADTKENRFILYIDKSFSGWSNIHQNIAAAGGSLGHQLNEMCDWFMAGVVLVITIRFIRRWNRLPITLGGNYFTARSPVFL